MLARLPNANLRQDAASDDAAPLRPFQQGSSPGVSSSPFFGRAFGRDAPNRATRGRWGTNLGAGAGVAAIYAALIVGYFLFGTGTVERRIEPRALVVDIRTDRPEFDNPAPLVPRIQTAPPVISIVTPQIVIATPPQRTAITVPPTPTAPSPSPEPPQPQAVASPPEIRLPYYDRVLSHLYRHKRYPRAARAHRDEGVVVLRFAMDRHGRVLHFEIIRSSGFADLDEEALALIRRAQPLPAFPNAMREANLDLEVPIEFSLR